jgi:23S rRNA C2498 (ribose-2'-O)-methylase RlmM
LWGGFGGKNLKYPKNLTFYLKFPSKKAFQKVSLFLSIFFISIYKNILPMYIKAKVSYFGG